MQYTDAVCTGSLLHKLQARVVNLRRTESYTVVVELFTRPQQRAARCVCTSSSELGRFDQLDLKSQRGAAAAGTLGRSSFAGVRTGAWSRLVTVRVTQYAAWGRLACAQVAPGRGRR